MSATGSPTVTTGSGTLTTSGTVTVNQLLPGGAAGPAVISGNLALNGDKSPLTSTTRPAWSTC